MKVDFRVMPLPVKEPQRWPESEKLAERHRAGVSSWLSEGTNSAETFISDF
jgi:hypothetical protein